MELCQRPDYQKGAEVTKCSGMRKNAGLEPDSLVLNPSSGSPSLGDLAQIILPLQALMSSPAKWICQQAPFQWGYYSGG